MTAGLVLGMAHTMVTPPASAAAVPDAKSSLWVPPGSRRCTCTSISPAGRAHQSLGPICLALCWHPAAQGLPGCPLPGYRALPLLPHEAEPWALGKASHRVPRAPEATTPQGGTGTKAQPLGPPALQLLSCLSLVTSSPPCTSPPSPPLHTWQADKLLGGHAVHVDLQWGGCPNLAQCLWEAGNRSGMAGPC